MGCPVPILQGMLMDVFRLGLKHGFNLPSFGEHSLLNSGFRMFLASGEWVGALALGDQAARVVACGPELLVTMRLMGCSAVRTVYLWSRSLLHCIGMTRWPAFPAQAA